MKFPVATVVFPRYLAHWSDAAPIIRSRKRAGTIDHDKICGKSPRVRSHGRRQKAYHSADEDRSSFLDYLAPSSTRSHVLSYHGWSGPQRRKEDVPAFAGNGLHPIRFVTGRSCGTEINVYRGIGIGNGPFLAADCGESLIGLGHPSASDLVGRFGIVLLGPNHAVVDRLLLFLEQVLEDELTPSAATSVHQRAALVELSSSTGANPSCLAKSARGAIASSSSLDRKTTRWPPSTIGSAARVAAGR